MSWIDDKIEEAYDAIELCEYDISLWEANIHSIEKSKMFSQREGDYRQVNACDEKILEYQYEINKIKSKIRLIQNRIQELKSKQK
jgi:hypothetical protein